MPRYLCPNHGFVEETRIIETDETFPVGGEDITVRVRVRTCSACQEWIGDDELDDVSLKMAFQAYRLKHDLITPAEIVEMRKAFGLSQRSFATLLGWGETMIHRYEANCLPDVAHNRFLRFLQNPEILEAFISEKSSSVAR